MKITNKKRFIKSCSFTIAIFILLILFFTNISFSHTEIKYETISVSAGDTLWSIAKFEQINNKYFKNYDIRDIIYQIKYINNLENNGILMVGDTLKIPTI